MSNYFQVQLPWFCIGGFVGALLILSVHYAKLGNDSLLEMQQEKCGSHTLAVENVIEVKQPDQDPLAEVLKSAVMDGNMVILTQGNEAWMARNSLFDLFLEGFHVGEEIEHLLNHLVIVTDMDILWFRNPLRHIAITSDLAFASDVFLGDEDSVEQSAPNGGFMFVKSSNKTIEFFKNWQDQRVNYPNQHDQDVLNKIKVEFSKRYQVRMQFVNTLYTSGFCQMSKDISKVCTVHANCCVGLQAKLLDLRSILEDWKAYKSIPPGAKEIESFRFRDHGGDLIGHITSMITLHLSCAPMTAALHISYTQDRSTAQIDLTVYTSSTYKRGKDEEG
ncbi:hypothetical protein LUZ61_017750 [Rhynchospora tenuis]|uniref:Nucleotide-diphospho-sugar transferase domain-containing protein n=1 Tax=Rhynchospora tenuis TaxID=198213 RepID=A0AAD5Z844_9POAL|nr:hypothetical protein LUZ61_017750 [Rhynchospora tenuis]